MGLLNLIKSILVPTPGVKIAMINVDVQHAEVSPERMKSIAAALTAQCQQHFSLPPPFGFGISATVRVVSSTSEIKGDEWVLSLISKPDIPGAYGYHDVTPTGLPVLKIFPLLDIQEGNPWSVTASHEVLEALADPEGSRACQDKTGKFWALEVCDGVEALSYELLGEKVSNFELPPYFEPIKKYTGVKLDYLGKCTKPMQTLPGGYNQWFDPTKGWQQVQHADVKPRPYRQSIKGRSHNRKEMFGIEKENT